MRTFVLSLAMVLGLAGTTPARSSIDDHASALAAVADVRAAVDEIVRIEDGYAVGHAAYARAAHRAMNALVGGRDDGYSASFGNPGDSVGTLGYLDRLLDREGASLWTPAVQGAKANLLAAAQDLHDALGEKEMEDYEADLTRAVANLGLVLGRSSQSGVLGGLSGALANTSLGVPRGAATVSACSEPLGAPAYGVVSGRLAYVALPRNAASLGTPENLSVSRVVVHGDRIVFYTHVAREAAALCDRVSRRERTRHVAVSSAATALYSAAQVQPGAAVYRQYCIQCHGGDMQGTAGPAVAGAEFLKTAKGNGWTLSDVRTTVFQNMPFSNPGSLKPKEYADVMAFLLASNCYPAGSKPFPQTDNTAFAKVKIGPHAGGKHALGKLGICAP